MARVGALVASTGVAVVTLALSVPAQAATTTADGDVDVMAWPSSCHTAIDTFREYSSAQCVHPNGGSWRAIAICEGPNGTVHRYGGWRQGGQSNAYCVGTELVRPADGGAIETRTW
jgi:hypothetical protein